MPSLQLNGEQSKWLEDALAGAFQSEVELDTMVFHATNRRLNEFVGEGYIAKSRAFLLVQAAETKGLTTELIAGAISENAGNQQLLAVVARLMPGFMPPAPAAIDLADPSRFDLTELDDTYWEAVRPVPNAAKRLVGFGVTYSDDVFVRHLRLRLAGYLGTEMTKSPDPYELNPKRSTAAFVLKKITEAKEALRSMHNLFVIRADAADDASIDELWQGVCREYPGALDSYLIVIIIRDAAAAFPSTVVRLPTPGFKYSHLIAWATQLANELRKADPQWDPPAEWAKLWSQRLYDSSVDDNVLNVRNVYDNMETDLRDLRRNAVQFRRTLKGE